VNDFYVDCNNTLSNRFIWSASQKKALRKVKWADHFGGSLEEADMDDTPDTAAVESAGDGNVSWTDRKKRDRLREKELLAQAK
jgi:hypothetical protein